LTVTYRGWSLGRDSAGGGYSADLASESLDDLGDRHVDTNGGHWRYDVAWAPSVRRAVVRLGVERPPNAGEPSSCHPARVAAYAMEACRVMPHERGGGLNGGHVAYVWSHAGVTYVISVHGYANEPRARAMMTGLATRLTGRPGATTRVLPNTSADSRAATETDFRDPAAPAHDLIWFASQDQLEGRVTSAGK
jgi:hypothetical protein